MALNLWKIGGQPTSFNPLTSQPFITIGIGTWIITFRAKSASSRNLKCWVSPSEFSNTDNITLTPTFTTYTITKKVTSGGQQIQFADGTGSNGDIIIDSITLVQKPLSKLTINGIDGFLSGKWSLHNTAVIIDDSTLQYSPTTNYQDNTLWLTLLPNTTYTFSFGGTGKVWAGLYNAVNGSQQGNALLSAVDAGEYNFTTNSYFIVKFAFTNYQTIGTLTFSKPVLNLGSIPAPYSKKTGDRMVLPTAKKNLFDGAVRNGYYTNTTGAFVSNPNPVACVNYIAVKPNTTYVLKNFDHSTTGNIIVDMYDTNFGFVLYTNSTSGNTHTFTTTSNTYFVRFSMDGAQLIDRFQLEQSTFATSYIPYAVQVNKKPQKYVPKKNLLPLPDASLYNQTGSGTNNTVSNNKLSVTNYTSNAYGKGIILNVIPGKTYTFSGFYETNTDNIKGYIEVGYSSTGHEMLSQTINPGNFNFTFTPTQSTIHFKFVGLSTVPLNSPVFYSSLQLEQGSTATPFENYQLVLPKRSTGLSFNGLTDYLQLPSMTMDAIEIECLIDSNQSKTPNTYLDLRPTLSTGYVASDVLGSYWQSIKVDGVSINSSVSIPRGKRFVLSVSSATSFTTSSFIFNDYANRFNVKGILYKVTCYLNGNIVAQYDFENPQNIIGNQVIPNAQNLIPSFEDARWTIHANAKVLGKDMLHLDATTGFQYSTIDFNGIENKSYFYNFSKCNGANGISYFDINGVKIGSTFYPQNNTGTVTTPLGTYVIHVSLYSNNPGSFDFIRPQLYQLSGKEGTIYGAPKNLSTSEKRLLYAKR